MLVFYFFNVPFKTIGMKKLLLGMLFWWVVLFQSNAQESVVVQEVEKPGLSLGVNISQWVVGQYQVEISQRFKNMPFAVSFQVFGGELNRRQVFSTGADFDTLHAVSTLGVGLGVRRYEKNASEGFFSQLSVFYKDVSKTYSRLDTYFEPFNIFSPTRYTYMQSTDRLAGFGLELLGGYRFLYDQFFVEANAGVVARFLQPQGPYLGQLSPWRFRSFTNTSGLNPIISLQIGIQL